MKPMARYADRAGGYVSPARWRRVRVVLVDSRRAGVGLASGMMDCDEVFIVDTEGFVLGVAGYEDVVRLTVQESIRRKAEADVTKRSRG